MRKARSSRAKDSIIEKASYFATSTGLSGLTIGQLASELKMSKSGLFAHFGSKENLQNAILNHIEKLFKRHVIIPCLREPKGKKRVLKLFDLLIDWIGNKKGHNGCLYVTASFEFAEMNPKDNIRKRIIEIQNKFNKFIIVLIDEAIQNKEFKVNISSIDFTYDLWSIMLGFHHRQKLLKDPNSQKHAYRSFNLLLKQFEK